MSTNYNYLWIEKKISNRRFIETVIVKVYVMSEYLQVQLIIKESLCYLTVFSSVPARMPCYSSLGNVRHLFCF